MLSTSSSYHHRCNKFVFSIINCPLLTHPQRLGRKERKNKKILFSKMLSGQLCLLIPTVLQCSFLPLCDSYIALHLPLQDFDEKGKCCCSFYTNEDLIERESKWLEPLSQEFLLWCWMQSSITFFTCWQVENNNSLYSASRPELLILHKKSQQAQPHKPLLTWRAGSWFSFVINFSALKNRNNIKDSISKAGENRVRVTETKVLIIVYILRVTSS